MFRYLLCVKDTQEKLKASCAWKPPKLAVAELAQ